MCLCMYTSWLKIYAYEHVHIRGMHIFMYVGCVRIRYMLVHMRYMLVRRYMHTNCVHIRGMHIFMYVSVYMYIYLL